MPIYYGGDRQLHIMQPFDNKKQEPGPEPHDIHEWVNLIETHGQIVVSFEALDDFIWALLRFRAARTGHPAHLSPKRDYENHMHTCPEHGTENCAYYCIWTKGSQKSSHWCSVKGGVGWMEKRDFASTK